MTESQGIELLHEDSITFVTLQRPDKLNAVDEPMADELLSAFEAISRSKARAMVLKGAGRAFSAGRDLSEADPLNEDGAAILRDTFNPLFAAIRGLNIPTICGVQGPALGVGLGLALACDVVIAANDAKIGSPFANIGAVLDSGGHFHLVQRVGSHRALELIYSARLMSGIEAAEMGLINRAVPGRELDEQVRELAIKVAAGPSAAFALSKRLVRSIEEGCRSFCDVLEDEAGAQGAASFTRDYAEGIGAFQAKRKAVFNGS